MRAQEEWLVEEVAGLLCDKVLRRCQDAPDEVRVSADRRWAHEEHGMLMLAASDGACVDMGEARHAGGPPSQVMSYSCC